MLVWPMVDMDERQKCVCMALCELAAPVWSYSLEFDLNVKWDWSLRSIDLIFDECLCMALYELTAPVWAYMVKFDLNLHLVWAIM